MNLKDFFSENSALYRHYHIDETREIVKQQTGVELDREETIAIVSEMREENGYGPIREAMTEDRESGEYVEESGGGFFRWLLGR